MRQRRFITAGLAAAAALAAAPAWAGAAPASLVDDTVPDFTAGTRTNTVVLPPGSVQLARVMKTEQFEGTTLPAAYGFVPWDPASTPPGSATVAEGKLSVDGARVHSLRSYGAGQVLDFTATFGAASFQHVGFGNTTEGVTDNSTFASGPWVMFSTGTSGGTTLFARIRTGATAATDLPDIPIPGVVPTAPHAYRIAWDANSVQFFVDDMTTPVATQPLTTPIAGEMRPAASDFGAGGPVLQLDSAGLLLHVDSGTFESRVHDASDARAVWGTLTPTVAGSQVSFATRTGNTATPDASWSAFEAIGDAGAIKSPPGRYIQYRATLTTADDRVTPTLEQIQLGYEIDTAGPAVSIDGVQASGTNATVTFSSTAGDVARFECSLDGGAFTTCASPKDFAGLAAGSHTIAVRAVDKVGNVGAAVSRSVTIVGASGAPNPPSSGGGDPDTRAPKVTLGSRTLRPSSRGVVKIRLTCPADEVRCRIGLRLKYGRTTAGRANVTLDGGETRKVKVQLSRKARLRLAARGRLNVVAIVTARDAAGNRKRSLFAMTIKAS